MTAHDQKNAHPEGERTMNRLAGGRGGTGRTMARMVAPLLLIGTLVGCDGLLEVEAPSQVIADDLENPTNAQLVVASAIADFECALGFYILSSSLLGDQLIDTQLAAATWDYDRRGFANARGAYADNTCNSTGNIFGVYRPVSTARWAADNALRNLQNWTDGEVAGDRQELIATAAAYSGYSHILLGEGFCSAAVDVGPELTPNQVFALAEERFTQAMEVGQAVGRSDLVNMSRVGRARVRLNMGRTAEAVADARQVPDGFEKMANYSTASARSGNHPYRWINRFGWASVGPLFQELEVDGVPDPRVPATNTGQTGADAFTVVWSQGKYPTEGSPIPIATWREAQLIIAEVEGGQEAVDIINTLRDRHGLPHFQSSDPAAIRAQVIEERQRELFLEGHHIHDIVRFNLPLNPAPGTPYPIKGGTYGDTTCLPLPEVERENNPNIS
jgi:starch-binding outer membrane protein, SusD/RagB family